MPLLRTLTLKLKTRGKLSPPSSPTTSVSPTSFEAVGRQEKQREKRNKSVESIENDHDFADVAAKVMLNSFEKRPGEKKLDRVSRFREELGEGD